MRYSHISGSEISLSPSAVLEEAQKRTSELRDLLGIEDLRNDDSFPQQLCQSLQVDPEVVKVMMTLEEMADLRKRASIMKALEESKSRIVTALEQCDEDENIPWGPNDDPAAMIIESNKSQRFLPFAPPGDHEMSDEMKRKKRQLEFMCNIDRYIASCKSKVIDMQELIEWMSNFSFEVTWDDVGVKPVQTREQEETDSYRGMVSALQQAWQCARKMQQLIEILANDDKYDVISGKFPAHVAAARRKKKGVVEGKLWCSHKLRKMLDKYEQMRLHITDKKQDLVEATLSQKHVTVQTPEEEAQPPKNPYKEIESTVLKEVTRSWKEATADVLFFMSEVQNHRFTKKSCKLRLSRAMLLLEFVCAAIEGKMIESARTEQQLEDAKNHVTRLQDEISTLNIKLAEAQKATNTAQRKIQKLKRQLDMINKQNQKLQAKLVEFKDEVAKKNRQIEELQELPNQAEFEENLAKIDELENELSTAEEEIIETKAALEERNNECNAIKMRFANEQEMNASLSEDIQVLEEENAKAEVRLAEMGKKLSEQESNVMSLRLMVYYKDEVIRRLKQAAIELKSSEKSRRSPTKPPPSPEEQTLRKSQDSLKKESSGKLKKEDPKADVPEAAQIPSEPQTPAVASTEQAKQKSSTHISVKIPDSQSPVAEEGQNEDVQRNIIRRMTDVGFRLHEASKKPSEPKTTKVIVITQDYKELQEKHDGTLREMDKTKQELKEVRDDFDVKLRQGLQSEKQKALLDSMKTEEDLQHLCFTVRDETMRVQKEMRKFSEILGSELNVLLGIKGDLLEFDSGKTNRPNGLATNVNFSFDSVTGPGALFSDQEAIGGMGGPGMMFGDNMMGFPPQAGMGGFDFGMGGQPMGSEMMGMLNAGGGGAAEATQDGANPTTPNINYWKSLKSALVSKPVDKEEKTKENEGIAQVSELLAQRRKAREQRKRELEESRTSDMSVTTITASQASQIFEDDTVPGPRAGLFPSDTPEKETLTGSKYIAENKENKAVSSCKTSENKEGKEASSFSKSLSESTEDKAEIEKLWNTSKQADTKEDISEKEPQAEKPANKKPLPETSQVDIALKKSAQDENVISQVEHKVEIQKPDTKKTVSKGRMLQPEYSSTPSKRDVKGVTFTLPQDHRRDSCRPAETHNILMERKRARFGERRRSSVVPFHPRRMSVDVRRQSIYPGPLPTKALKIRGFFGLGPASSLTDKPRPPTPVKQKPKLPKEPEPLKQAEFFVRDISKQVQGFLEKVNLRLIEIVRKNKQENDAKKVAMENKMMQERVKYKAEIASVCEERDQKSKELNNTKQILVDLGFGMGSSSKLDVRSSLPVDLIKRLKEAERGLDEAKERLERAAFQHEKHASEYMNLSYNLDNQLKQDEMDKKKLQRKLKEEVAAKNELKGQLYNTRLQQKQKLFLSLKNLKRNYDTVQKNSEIGNDIRKVALSLLRRSMLYPTVCLTSLVHYYCQHVKFTQCQERVRKLINDKSPSLETYTHDPRRPTRQKQILTTLLAGVTMKRELAKQRWEKRRNDLEADRQKLFLKLALVLNRIQKDQRSLEIYQPIILQVSGKGLERSHHNTPVNMSLGDLRILLPENDFCRFPKIPSVMDPQITSDEDLALEGRQPPRDMRRLKGAVAHWFPDDSLSCPFAVRSGHIAPVNSHISIVSSRTGNSYPAVTPASRFRSRSRRIEVPRIMEMEIQSGLRNAKRMVVKRLGGGRFSSTSMYSTTSSVSLCLSTSVQNGASFSARYDEQFYHGDDSLHYDRFGEENGGADVSSMADLLSCPLPSIPTPPGRRDKTPSRSNVPSAMDYVNDYSRNLSSPSMRSSTQATPDLPPLPSNNFADNAQTE